MNNYDDRHCSVYLVNLVYLFWVKPKKIFLKGLSRKKVHKVHKVHGFMTYIIEINQSWSQKTKLGGLAGRRGIRVEE